jgi:molybdenum cofactor biosynthesis enzyme MoaA
MDKAITFSISQLIVNNIPKVNQDTFIKLLDKTYGIKFDKDELKLMSVSINQKINLNDIIILFQTLNKIYNISDFQNVLKQISKIFNQDLQKLKIISNLIKKQIEKIEISDLISEIKIKDSKPNEIKETKKENKEQDQFEDIFV